MKNQIAAKEAHTELGLHFALNKWIHSLTFNKMASGIQNYLCPYRPYSEVWQKIFSYGTHRCPQNPSKDNKCYVGKAQRSCLLFLFFGVYFCCCLFVWFFSLILRHRLAYIAHIGLEPVILLP
jgi:hypothetical protein